MQLIRKIVRHIARGVMKKRSKRGRARSDRDVAAAARPAAELPVSPELKWTVAALALPAFSYLLVYSINVGQARYYGIPDSFVSVAVGDVLRTALTIGVLGGLFVFSLRGIALDEPLHPGLREVVAPVIASALLALLFWWKDGPSFVSWTLLAVTLLNVAIMTVKVVRGARRTGSLKALLDRLANGKPDGLQLWSPRGWGVTFRRALEMRPLSLIVVLLAFLYLATLGSLVGEGLAARQKEYPVTADNSGRVVLMVTNGNAIVGTMADEGWMSRNVEVIPLSELGPVTIESTGPLAPLTTEQND